MRNFLSRILRSAGPGAAAWVFAGALMVLCTLMRAGLIAFRWPDLPHGGSVLLSIFWAGFRLDWLMCGLLALPAAVGGTLLPERFFSSRPGRSLSEAGYFLFLFGFIFLGVVELAFFQEFDARFNTIAVDYLIYPTEVGKNIWESYPLVKIFLGVFAAAALAFRLTLPALRKTLSFRAPWDRRAASLGAYLAVLGALSAALGLTTSQVSDNRIANEIAGDGYFDFFYSLWSNDLPYGQYYRTMDPSRAIDRVRELLQRADGASLDNPANPLERRITGGGPFHEPNVVIVLDESFGAKFTSARNYPLKVTPRFDALSKEGILFDNFYATGSRTARGLEAVLCSFPPVPEESVIKRPKYDGLFTLADVFKSNGYDTLFVYGGRGLFDNMKRFALKNGFDRFIEQKDYKTPTFTTAWGVCDEDIFHRALEEFDALDRSGKRFFGLVLTVSNHKPYTYPPGRIDLDPEAHSRDHAFKYADWALGDFFERAEKYPFFRNTIFAFLGDHGARVYGADFIPIDSYEVPFLLYAPGRLKPRVVETLGCSMDVAPTILGLTDLSYRSVFFGRDLFGLKPGEGYALMQHDRDVGLLTSDRLALLGVPKTAALYRFDRASRRFTPIPRPDADGTRQIQTAISFFQTAYDFYSGGAYRLAPVEPLPADRTGPRPAARAEGKVP